MDFLEKWPNGPDTPEKTEEFRRDQSEYRDSLRTGDYQRRREDALTEQRKTILQEAQQRRLATIPPRYRDATEAPAEALGWIQNPHDTLILAGPKGTGKTHAAWALFAHHATNATWDTLRAGAAVFWSLPQLLDRLRPGNEEYTKPSASAWEGSSGVPHRIDHMHSAQHSPLLILDDVGAERLTDWGREQLFLLIDHRYNQMLPTIVTTNLTPAELKQNIGDRIADRLVQGALLVPMTGQSRRVPNQPGT
jgi:DNA replication protein DnaC